MSEGHPTPGLLLKRLPSECDECGGEDYKYTVGKTVRISIYDGEPYVDSADEGISDVTCMACDKVIVEIEAVNDDTDLVDQMIEA